MMNSYSGVSEQVLFAGVLRLLRSGHEEDALQTILYAAGKQPTVDRICVLGAILLRLGRPLDAGMLLRAATESFPKDPRPWIGLARTRLWLGRITDAHAAIATALSLSPADSEILALAATISVLLRHDDDARRFAEMALAKDPASRQAAAALSETLALLGRYEQAQTTSLDWFKQRPIRHETYPNPCTRHLVVLEGVGCGRLGLSQTGTVVQPEGHSNISSLLPLGSFQVTRVTVDALPPNSVLPECDLILNTMAEPFLLQSALTHACNLLRGRPQRVINDPNYVQVADREAIAEKCTGIARLIVPTCRLIEAATASDRRAKALAAIAAEGMKWPVLVRPAGAHTTQMTLLNAPDEAMDYRFSSRYNAVYVTEFKNCHRPDGYWHKTRAVIVGSIPIIEHHYITDEFCVRSASARSFAYRHSWADEEAATIISTKDEALFSTLQEIAKRVGLDVFAVDFAQQPDGQIVLFEVSSCVRFILPTELSEEGKHVVKPIEDIRKSFHSLLADDIGLGHNV